MRKRTNGFTRLLLFTVSLLLIISILLTISFFKVKPLIYTYAKSQAETILLNAANQAVVSILKEEGISYDKIVNLSKDANGYITGLEINIEQINLLKSKINAKISEISAEKEYYDLYIPFGTILGNEYTNGMGPRIRFAMQITSTTVVDFESNFTHAGINQVLHQIIIKMNITGNILMIGCTEGFSTSTTAIAAQTVIVGNVPDSYTDVIETGVPDITGDIFDYADID